MSHTAEFRIDWDLHELGDKERPPVVPTAEAVRLSPRDFARAITMGDIPANAADLLKDKAA